MADRKRLATRRLLTLGLVPIASALIDFCFSAFSMVFSALPPAHHAQWMTLLEGRCSSRLLLDAVNAAVQWYGGPVTIGVAGFVVGMVAQVSRAERSFVVIGVIVFAIAKTALSGVVDATSVFSVFFALVCTAGGGALADMVVTGYRHYVRRPAAASSERRG